MKRLKKAIITALTMGTLIFSSCGEVPSVEGDQLIYKAREDYKALNSAKVIMTNVDTDEIEQTFNFKYDEKDILLYSYEGKSENSTYAQYNNGAESFTYENGEYSYFQKNDKGFELYTRELTHAQADEGLILFVPEAITTATSDTDQDTGITHVFHEYDVKKIGAQTEDGKVTGFSAEYFFKGEELLYFVETTETKENDEDKRYSYKIEITDKNKVQTIDNTVDKYKP